jgi:hypothetical protein
MSQESVVQMSLSSHRTLQQGMGLETQTPARQTSLVHESRSLQSRFFRQGVHPVVVSCLHLPSAPQ